jgi:hypothetical protein
MRNNNDIHLNQLSMNKENAYNCKKSIIILYYLIKSMNDLKIICSIWFNILNNINQEGIKNRSQRIYSHDSFKRLYHLLFNRDIFEWWIDKNQIFKILQEKYFERLIFEYLLRICKIFKSRNELKNHSSNSKERNFNLRDLLISNISW